MKICFVSFITLRYQFFLPIKLEKQNKFHSRGDGTGKEALLIVGRSNLFWGWFGNLFES